MRNTLEGNKAYCLCRDVIQNMLSPFRYRCQAFGDAMSDYKASYTSEKVACLPALRDATGGSHEHLVAKRHSFTYNISIYVFNLYDMVP
jgi:hypothetical protein